MGDLDILSIEQCSDTDIASDSKKKEQKRRIVEEKFFRGGEVEWWNFCFNDDHVLKRDIHSSLMQEVRAALSKSEEADERVGVVTLLHQPGAGGTSSARQVLWELKEQYRCCLVKRITDQTCEQVTNLRSYEDADQPKPVLALIDNEDDEKISNLYAILEDKARKASRDSAFPLPVFCVLLICQRRASLPIQSEAGKVQLKHELTKRELSWFETKSAQLEKKFKEGSKVNPKHLISFNILKENFDKGYVKRTVHTFVNDIKDTNELKVLKFLSLLNRFDVDFSHVPVACFDAIMQKTKKGKYLFKTGVIQRSHPRSKGWETGLSSSFRVLLNIASKSKTNGTKVQTLRIINFIMAEEILSNLLKMFDETIVDVMNQLLDSDIFQCKSPHSNQLLTIIRNILKKRCYVDDRKEKFSTFVLHAIKAVDIDATVDVMIKVFDIDEDVNLAQQIARFYIQSKNWKMAEYYAKITTQKMHRNSFFWDTYAMVYKEQLLEEYTESTKTDSVIGEDKARQILHIALTAIKLYRKEQEVSESEKSAANNAGYFGEIRVILLLLNIFPKFHGYTGSEDLHRFLVEETFVPDWIGSLQPEAIHHLKSMQKFSLHSLRRLDDEFHQLKSISQTDFLPKDTHLTRDCLIKLKENLDHYFGEFSDTIPGSLSQLDAMEYRRSRVRTMGITSLNGALKMKEDTLLKAFDIISENVDCPKPSSFDFVTVLTITIAYYAVTKKLLKNLSFQTVIDWSVKLYDLRQQQDPRPYLETFQYLVLFNLPTEDRKQYKLCPSSRLEEATKLWKETFYHNHPRQKDGERYLRKKDATYFFLGNGRDMDGLVYYEELGLWKKGNSDRVWRTEKALSRFRRMRGVLQRDGLEISMQLVTAGGNKFNLSIPTSLPIRNKSLLQKNVFFALGFGWAGLKAYDVTDEDLQDSPRFQRSQEQPGWIARYRLQTGTTKKLEDIMKSIRDVEASLEKTSKAGKGAKSEQKSLEKKLKFLIQERDDLLGGQ